MMMSVKHSPIGLEEGYIQLFEDSSLLTNFDISKLKIYEDSVKLYNSIYKDDELYIVDEAYDVNNNIVERHKALHSSTRKDKTIFWNYHKACEAFYNVFTNSKKEFTKEIADKLVDALELNKE